MTDLDLDRAVLLFGDCRERLRELPDASVDAVVTDPPYELGFMGKGWDSAGVAFEARTWAEVLRVLKPGGHMLAFGGTRTHHRIWCAIEDAGFEIRDTLAWMYGTGFPKSLNPGRAIDMDLCGLPGRHYDKALPKGAKALDGDHICPETPGGDVHRGGGTALKPAQEPICLARKPLAGTVAGNVAAYGTGALNIDGCRIEYADEADRAQAIVPQPDFKQVSGRSTHLDAHARNGAMFDPKGGRWPANVLLDEEAAADLDRQAPHVGAAAPVRGTEPSAAVEPGTITNSRARVPGAFHGDSGGASRFFYVAKAGRKERDLYCEHLAPKSGGEATDREDGSIGVDNPRAGAGRTGGARNFHPTVKPLQLMRYLVRLVTPPGGIVLDPFTGSGSTAIAALTEGFRFLGVEQGEDYWPIAEARVRGAHDFPERARAA